MANNFAPFGFRPVNTSNGPMNWRISTRRIASTNATPIYKGDATVPVVVGAAPGATNGYITQAQADAAYAEPLNVVEKTNEFLTLAPWVTETVRLHLPQRPVERRTPDPRDQAERLVAERRMAAISAP